MTTNMRVLSARGVAVAGGFALLALAAASANAAIVYGSMEDRVILQSSSTTVQDSFNAEVGVNGGIMRTIVMPFQLPARPAGMIVSAADMQVRALRNFNNGQMNVDLYGLTPRLSPTVLASDAYAGPLDAAATRIQDNYIIESATDINNYVLTNTNAAGDQALADYLNNAYSTVGAGGWVFLRLSCDNIAPPNLNFYFVDSADFLQFGLLSRGSQMNITFGVPTPGAAVLLAGGSIAATRRRRARCM